MSITSIDCTLVTCDEVPALDPDDRLLLDEFHRRGISASVGVWSDPAVDWSATRLCILRSTWDYHRRYREFMTWVKRVTAMTALRNDENLLRWSAHKSYLREIESRGVPVVPTVWLSRGAARNLSALLAERGWHEAVIKPARGAAASEVMLVRSGARELALGQVHLDRLVQFDDVLVQPFLEGALTYGERALVFFSGRFSHAVVKKPFDTVLVVSDSRSALIDASDEEVAIAERAIEAAPGPSLYARVDLLRDVDGAILVNEVELLEPALYLAIYDPARLTFADAVERELDALTRSPAHP